MRIKKIYKSYGVLAHEKVPVYTADAPASDIYDIISVELPEGWEWATGATYNTLIQFPDGYTYYANDILTTVDDEPAIVIPSLHKQKPMMLSVIGAEN